MVLGTRSQHHASVRSEEWDDPVSGETQPSMGALDAERNFPSGITEIAPRCSKDPRRDTLSPPPDSGGQQVARIPLASRMRPTAPRPSDPPLDSAATQQSMESPAESAAQPRRPVDVEVQVSVESADTDEEYDDIDAMLFADDEEPPTEVPSSGGRYLALAQRAAEAGDAVSAANAIRIACALRPDRSGEIIALAQTDSHVVRAKLAEDRQQWDEASVTYARAARSQVDGAELLERAAYCRIRAGDNPRAAIELAQRAVWIRPRDPVCRATLAEAYAAGDQHDEAIDEIRRAVRHATDGPQG